MRFARVAGIVLFVFFPLASEAETLVVGSKVIGKSPDRIGYNIAHFMPDTNAADWWRYSGVKSARVFISASLIEPEDDIPGRGDGVADGKTFAARRAALRADPLSAEVSGVTTPAHLRSPFINWPALRESYETTISPGNNRFRVNETFHTLREMDVEILVQITAYQRSFPISGEGDWAGLWELWQHFYIQAYYLGGEFDVERYSMYNEPNHKAAGGISPEDWLLRLRFASDAIQSAIADVNRDKGKRLTALIHAPTTSGTIGVSLEKWGTPAVQQRHQRIDGSRPKDWRNFQIYSYQYYGLNRRTLYGQATALRSAISALMPGEAPFPYAITEFNTRTGASFDKVTATPDRPSHYSGLAAGAIALADAGVEDMYLFKFGMTRAQSSRSHYPVQKNGTHYVENGDGVNRYGGITRSGEVWRMFNRMAAGGRDRLDVKGGNRKLITMATTDGETVYVFVANTSKDPQEVDFDVSALSVPAGNLATLSEVSDDCYGAVRWLPMVQQGKIHPHGAQIPPESVWLLCIPLVPQVAPADDFPGVKIIAAADANVRDGRFRKAARGSSQSLRVRNGTLSPDDRKAALIGFDLSETDLSKLEAAVLTLRCSTDVPGKSAQAHLYGLTDCAIDEASVNWASISALRQRVPGGALIANNVILGDGKTRMMLGQVTATSEIADRHVDVTDFIKKQGRGNIAFLVLQESRWDTNLYDKKPGEVKINGGDTQQAGLIIASRESVSPPVLRLVMRK